mgnify:FL=1
MSNNIDSEVISLDIFRQMWNNEIAIDHEKMVDALDIPKIWEFVVDETSQGSLNVFYLFGYNEMPSKDALVQLMDNVSVELFRMSPSDYNERFRDSDFMNYAIVYYVLKDWKVVPNFYTETLGDMYYDGYWFLGDLYENERRRFRKSLLLKAKQYGSLDAYEDLSDMQNESETENNTGDSATFWFIFIIVIVCVGLIMIGSIAFPYIALAICLVSLLVYWLLKRV